MSTIGKSLAGLCWRRERALPLVLLAAVALTPAAALTPGTGRSAAARMAFVAHGPGDHATDPASAGPFVTLLFSRTQITAADGCVQDNDGIARLDTSVAPYLRSLGLTGTGTLVTGKIKDMALTCTHYGDSLMGSWGDAANLAQNYGWSFVSHTATYPANMSNLTPAQQYAQTCGSAATIDAHGLPGGHGLIAYPGAQPFPTAMQTNYGAKCFAWGRRYGRTGITTAAAAGTSPYLQRTRADNGGPCNTPSAPCYTISAIGSARYTLPSTIISTIQALQPGQWFTLQSFILVTGTNPPYTHNDTQWDCTSPDPALHWTNDEERYCYSDWQQIVNAIAAMPDITVTDPLTVGVAFGRPASYPDPVVNISQQASNSTVSGTVPVSGTAQPQGSASIAQVQVSVDTGVPQPATGTTNWTASIDTTSLANGPHTITATATDSNGNVGATSVTINVDNPSTTACPATPAGTTELSGNVSLESAQTGWTGRYNANSTLAHVEPAGGSYDGVWALQAGLKPGTTGTAGVTNTNPIWASSTTAGQMYTASAFVRANTPGEKVTIALREKTSTRTSIGSHAATITLGDANWHQISTTYTAHATGNLLHYPLYASNLANSGQNFLADCLSLQAP